MFSYIHKTEFDVIQMHFADTYMYVLIHLSNVNT